MNKLYFALEGGEKVGKSTQLAALKILLELLGYSVGIVREPGGTDFGEEARKIFKNRAIGITSLSNLFLMSACRHQLITERVRPLLQDGQIAISDRCLESSRVYQGYIEGLDLDLINQVSLHATEGLTPRKIFYLDLTVEETMHRLGQTALVDKDRFDIAATNIHARIRDAYLQEAEKYPELIEIVDASKPIEEITRHIGNRIIELISQ